MSTNYDWMFVQNKLFKTRITIFIPWYDLCFLNIKSIFDCFEKLPKIGLEVVSELTDDVDDDGDKTGSSKSTSLPSVSD